IGGSIFGEELTDSLTLDFNSFPIFRSSNPREILNAKYDEQQKDIQKWIAENNYSLDPYLFFISSFTQNRVQELLKVNPDSGNPGRISLLNKTNPTLSSLIGNSACAEQSALGQFILQNVLENGYSSSYMSGVTTSSPSSNQHDHSFIVLKDKIDKNYVFDIARPKSLHNIPRLLETDVPLIYTTLRDKKNYLIGATESFDKGRLYYGVGNPNSCEEPIIAN
ncbi:MAG: hypothetical protein WCK29_02875, partial [archaeon]